MDGPFPRRLRLARAGAAAAATTGMNVAGDDDVARCVSVELDVRAAPRERPVGSPVSKCP